MEAITSIGQREAGDGAGGSGRTRSDHRLLEARRGLIRGTSELDPGDVRLKYAKALLDELA
jgi:hypothetical protein